MNFKIVKSEVQKPLAKLYQLACSKLQEIVFKNKVKLPKAFCTPLALPSPSQQQPSPESWVIAEGRASRVTPSTALTAHGAPCRSQLKGRARRQEQRVDSHHSNSCIAGRSKHLLQEIN